MVTRRFAAPGVNEASVVNTNYVPSGNKFLQIISNFQIRNSQIKKRLKNANENDIQIEQKKSIGRKNDDLTCKLLGMMLAVLLYSFRFKPK